MNLVELSGRAPEAANDDDAAPIGPRPNPTPRSDSAPGVAGRADGAPRRLRPPRPRRLSPAAVIAQALDRPSALDAFWGVWLAHQELLRHRSMRLSGGNRADAEDALSNAMLRAAHAYVRQPVQNPRAWLLRILHNACMDQHRRNACLAAIDEDAGPRPGTSADCWEDAAPSPEDELSQSQMEQAWRQAMSALPGALGDPLQLHLDGWPDELIALHLNVSREVVRKRRQLAKARLRALLNL
jgi:RNA polymerase sigma factor (sigma-70 family)